jgi:hypothetical protein
MRVIDHMHVRVALPPETEAPVGLLIEQETGWVTEPFGTLWRRGKSFVLVRNLNYGLSEVQVVA